MQLFAGSLRALRKIQDDVTGDVSGIGTTLPPPRGRLGHRGLPTNLMPGGRPAYKFGTLIVPTKTPPPDTHHPHTRQSHPRHHPSPQGESGTTPLYGGGRDVQHRHTAKKTKPHNPPPVGKAGFEVWVLSKGGLVRVHHCRLYCTVVYAHLIGEIRRTLGCVRVYGMVRRAGHRTQESPNGQTFLPRSSQGL